MTSEMMPTERSEKPHPRRRPSAPEERTILVASETNERSTAVVRALERRGQSARFARAPLELLQLAGIAGRGPLRPAAIVLDVTGSAWATLDLLEVVCAAHWTIPVVALVAQSDAAAYTEARRLGATHIVTLPANADEIVHEILAVTEPGLHSPVRGAA